MATLVGCYPREIARYENGKFRPRDERLMKLASVLRVTPSWLIFGEPGEAA